VRGAGAGRWGGRIGVGVESESVSGGGGCGREKSIKDGVDGTEDVEWITHRQASFCLSMLCGCIAIGNLFHPHTYIISTEIPNIKLKKKKKKKEKTTYS